MPQKQRKRTYSDLTRTAPSYLGQGSNFDTAPSYLGQGSNFDHPPAQTQAHQSALIPPNPKGRKQARSIFLGAAPTALSHLLAALDLLCPAYANSTQTIEQVRARLNPPEA